MGMLPSSGKMNFPESGELELTPKELSDIWVDWRKTGNKEQFNKLMTGLRPTISSAINTFASGRNSPSVKSRARILTAQALEKWDPKKGSALKGFIFQQLQPLTRYSARAAQPLPMPEKAESELRRIQQAETALTSSIGREPTDVELSDYLNLAPARIQKIRQRYAHPSVSEGQMMDMGDPEKSDLAPAIHKPNLEEIWGDFVYMDSDPVDQKIIEWRTGRNGKPLLSNQQIAKRLKMTPSAVSQRAGRIQARLMEGAKYGYA